MIVVAALGIGWAMYGCKKEKNIDNLLEVQSKNGSALNRVKSDNGVLIFETESDLYQAMDELANLTRDEREAWEKRMNFESLNTIWNKVNDAEVEHIDALIGDHNPDLSVEEFAALGIIYSPTQIKTQYIEKGILTETLSDDNSKGLEPTVKNVSFYNVIGEKGAVIAGNQRITCDGFVTKYFDLESNELLHELNLLDKNATFTVTRGIGPTPTTRDDWQYFGSNYRVKCYVYFHSSNGNTFTVLNTTFQWVSRAERRILGFWNIRNNYTPIRGFNANWTFRYETSLINTTSATVYIEPGNTGILGGSALASPVNWNALTTCCPSGTNATTFNLRPHGVYSAPNGTYWSDCARLVGGTFSANIDGTNYSF